jgi:hypothetical protein
MSEAVEATEDVGKAISSMPFHLREMELKFEFSNIHPIFSPIDKMRKEIKFIILLAFAEWNKNLIVALFVGTLAFILGSLSADIFSGGNPDLVGLEGMSKVGSFSFFQMLLALIAWVWFVYLTWIQFPVMRVHSLSMLLIWNGVMFMQILFHQNNANFPQNMVLSDMMYGVLIMLVIFFFVYFFWKAVIETRDLHVQIHHVHEDVRVMEQEMREHSLVGWGSLLVFWLVNTFYSCWNGVHYIARRGDQSSAYYFMHIISGLLIVPVFMLLMWYPQRMLGSNVRISTTAAITAEIELSQGTIKIDDDAKCPDCKADVDLQRESDGQISVPCSTETCIDKTGIIGTVCNICEQKFPTRFECNSCGANVPYIECIPDLEAW